ncbi:MAG TPA: ankyrin repeat domain-containing protein [Candidatus Babeliales bacterium]|nr:ankyrin repeat domain-containing protein [Candidatus Babeliales bacterium]
MKKRLLLISLMLVSIGSIFGAPYQFDGSKRWGRYSATKALGLEDTATSAQIKKAYRKLAMKYHPDKHPNATEEEKISNKEHTQEINSAYKWLNDNPGTGSGSSSSTSGAGSSSAGSGYKGSSRSSSAGTGSSSSSSGPSSTGSKYTKEEIQQKLFEYIKDGNLQGVTKLMSSKTKNVDVNFQNAQGFTPLLFAIYHKQLKIALELLNTYKANPNLGTPTRVKPLIRAYGSFHAKNLTDIIDALIKAGADVNIKNPGGQTPLFLAASKGNLDLTRLLLKAHARLDLGDQSNKTPLMEALDKGWTGVALELIKAGVLTDTGISGQSLENKTALMYYLSDGKKIEKSVLNALINANVSLNRQNKNGLTALMIAAERGNREEAIRILLDHGANQDLSDQNGDTALLLALKNTSLPASIAELMIQKGANVNAKNNAGKTPLMEALSRGFTDASLELIKKGASVKRSLASGETTLMAYLSDGKKVEKSVLDALIKGGVDVNAVNKMTGKTALMLAAEKGSNENAISILLDHHANLNTFDHNGDTALMLALMNQPQGHYAHLAHPTNDVTSLLIRKGANINHKNHAGETAFSIARSRGYAPSLLDLLSPVTPQQLQDHLFGAVKRGDMAEVKNALGKVKDVNVKNADGDTPLLYAIIKKQPQIAIDLLETYKANPNLSNTKGELPLELAIKSFAIFDKSSDRHTDLVNLVKALIKARADVNALGSKEHKTPLMEALHMGLTSVSLDLIKAGANLSALSSNKKTTLMYYLMSGGEAGKAVLNALFNAHVSVNKQNEHGQTALMIATGMGSQEEAIEFLLNHHADPNVVDHNGNTALMILLKNVKLSDTEKSAIAKLMIAKGVNLGHKNNKGQTAFSIAKAAKEPDASLIKLLEPKKESHKEESASDKAVKAFFDAVKKKHIKEIFELALKPEAFDALGREAALSTILDIFKQAIKDNDRSTAVEAGTLLVREHYITQAQYDKDLKTSADSKSDTGKDDSDSKSDAGDDSKSDAGDESDSESEAGDDSDDGDDDDETDIIDAFFAAIEKKHIKEILQLSIHPKALDDLGREMGLDTIYDIFKQAIKDKDRPTIVEAGTLLVKEGKITQQAYNKAIGK